MFANGADSWFAFQVVPRHEQKIKVMLEHRGCVPFLPTFLVRRKWSDRIKLIEEPLLPGYVFCRTQGFFVRSIRGTPGVIRIVSSAGKPCPIADEEIESLQRIVQSQRKAGPFLYFKSGQRVEVVRGPLSGIRGIITRVKNSSRLIISVDLIMRSVYFELDQSEVATLRYSDYLEPSASKTDDAGR
jgi:transcriptional antiterminator NusG